MNGLNNLQLFTKRHKKIFWSQISLKSAQAASPFLFIHLRLWITVKNQISARLEKKESCEEKDGMSGVARRGMG